MKKATIIATALSLVLFLPTVAALAQANDPGQSTSNPANGQSTSNPANGQTTGTQSVSGGISNPLKGVNSLAGFFYLVANFVYSLSYAVIAFFLILAGFKFVKAQGNPDALSDAKKTFYYTIIGAVLLIGAQVITEVVRNVINQFAKNPI